MSNTPVMESEDLIASLQRERDDLAAECMALSNRLKQTPDVRAIVGKLRRIRETMHLSPHEARQQIVDLLRRLDES